MHVLAESDESSLEFPERVQLLQELDFLPRWSEIFLIETKITQQTNDPSILIARTDRFIKSYCVFRFIYLFSFNATFAIKHTIKAKYSEFSVTECQGRKCTDLPLSTVVTWNR
jgi:hypothetical protein